MKMLINLALTLTAIAYPLLWFWEKNYSEWLTMLPLIMALLWGIKAIQAVGFYQKFAFLMAMLLGVIGLTRTAELMLWYPVIISVMMLAIFGSSLWAKQTIVERLARLTEPDLPEQGVRYTRKVTQIWCGVFIFNMLVTIALILANELELWAIYSGVISYLIIGGVMAAEWLVRQFVKKQYEKNDNSHKPDSP